MTRFARRGESVVKRFLPRTLLARSLLIIVSPLVLLQIVATYIFYERHWETIAWRLSTAVAGDIAAVIEALPRYASDAERRVLFQSAYRNMGLTLELRPGATLPRRPSAPARSPLVAPLSQALDHWVQRPYLIEPKIGNKQVRILVQLNDGVLEVTTSTKRLYSTTTYIFVLWMVGTSLILFGVATLFMRNQVRPIRRLAQAADHFGKGRNVPDFKPEGAAEVRQAAEAFRIMRARIERQIAQRTEMLAGVSHDLGTVLTRMKLELAMLGDGPEAAALRSDVAEMEKMVEAYLAFARGEGAEAAEPTDLSALIEEVAAGFRRNGRDVACTVAPGLTAPVRPASFKRCLMNVLSNATQHAGRVWLSAARHDHSIDIDIDDDGPGIPPDQREAVFKPFFRLDPARNLETGGVGLGLAIARDVMRRHGGDIVLGDSPRGGLRATLRLPL